jgi:hypothetical protein
MILDKIKIYYNYSFQLKILIKLNGKEIFLQMNENPEFIIKSISEKIIKISLQKSNKEDLLL